ncbi:hypothetical protein ACLB2K_055510 [Fragaria x ananassa]
MIKYRDELERRVSLIPSAAALSAEDRSALVKALESMVGWHSKKLESPELKKRIAALTKIQCISYSIIFGKKKPAVERGTDCEDLDDDDDLNDDYYSDDEEEEDVVDDEDNYNDADDEEKNEDEDDDDDDKDDEDNEDEFEDDF